MTLFEISHHPWYYPTNFAIPLDAFSLSEAKKDYFQGALTIAIPLASLSKTFGTPLAAINSVSRLFYFLYQSNGQLKSREELQLDTLNFTSLALSGLSIISFIFRKTLVGLALCDGARFCLNINCVRKLHSAEVSNRRSMFIMFECTAYAFSALFHIGLLLYGSPLLLGSFFISQTLATGSFSYFYLSGLDNKESKKISFTSLTQGFAGGMISLLMVKSFYSLLTGNLE